VAKRTFRVNQELLAKARRVLGARTDLYLVLGGSCAGKSTICRIISEKMGMAIYDMDSHIYESYMGRYSVQRHPANKSWFSAPNPLAWALSLTAEQFNGLNRATTAEYLDLLADDLADREPEALLIDGGFTHPSLLVEVFAPRNLFCIETIAADRISIWENAEDRGMMRQWIRDLPNPDEMWHKFLLFDGVIADTLATESRAHSVPTVLRDREMSADELADLAMQALAI